MKNDKRQKPKAETAGFTIVEIVAVLVLLGILAAVAVPKFFDLSSDAEKKAAEAALMEAQVRINAGYSKAVYAGSTCEAAVKKVNTLALIGDAGTNKIGKFEFKLESGDEIVVAPGTYVTLTATDSKRAYEKLGQLFVPTCESENSGDNSDNGSSGGSGAGSDSGSGSGGNAGGTGGGSGGTGSGEDCDCSNKDDGSGKDEGYSGINDDYLGKLKPFPWDPLEDGMVVTFTAPHYVLIKKGDDFYVNVDYTTVHPVSKDEDKDDPTITPNPNTFNENRPIVKVDVNNIRSHKVGCTYENPCGLGTLYKAEDGRVYVSLGYTPVSTPYTNPANWGLIQGYRK